MHALRTKYWEGLSSSCDGVVTVITGACFEFACKGDQFFQMCMNVVQVLL